MDAEQDRERSDDPIDGLGDVLGIPLGRQEERASGKECILGLEEDPAGRTAQRGAHPVGGRDR
jgi:hypothetical protein